MLKKFNIFIFSIGILLIICAVFLELFTTFHLPFIKKYISFIFYFIIFIYWSNDKKFKFKYFSYYLIISIYIDFLLATTLFYVLFNSLFSNYFIICEKIFTIITVGFAACVFNSFLYNFFKFKSYFKKQIE